ncbi:MAG: hypothetical protein ACC707_00855 [Thiohalomonadales bacterium]
MAPQHTITLIAKLRDGHLGCNKIQATELLESGASLMQHVAKTLNKTALQ